MIGQVELSLHSKRVSCHWDGCLSCGPQNVDSSYKSGVVSLLTVFWVSLSFVTVVCTLMLHVTDEKWMRARFYPIPTLTVIAKLCIPNTLNTDVIFWRPLSTCWSVLDFWKINLKKSSLTNWIFKGQLISKTKCQAMDSSKKRTNEFVFTSMRRVFVRFFEESLGLSIFFRNYLTFKLESSAFAFDFNPSEAWNFQPF